MTASLGVGPLGGILGATTCSIFKLDPLTQSIPLEPLPDALPGGIFTALRITLDMIDDERISHVYSVTKNPLQDAADATSNVHRKLRELTVKGTLTNQLFLSTPISDLDVAIPVPNPGGFLRFDLIKLQNLETIADERQAVLVTTPRYALARAFIESIERDWSPGDGESTNVTIKFVEANVISSVFGAPINADYSAQAPGNNVATGGGESFTPAGDYSLVNQSPGVAPRVSAVGP